MLVVFTIPLPLVFIPFIPLCFFIPFLKQCISQVGSNFAREMGAKSQGGMEMLVDRVV